MERFINIEEEKLTKLGFQLNIVNDDYFGDDDLYNVYTSPFGTVLCQDNHVVWVED